MSVRRPNRNASGDEHCQAAITSRLVKLSLAGFRTPRRNEDTIRTLPITPKSNRPKRPEPSVVESPLAIRVPEGS